jgi:hypothetical protein
MKITLEKDEHLEIVIVDKGKTVGRLELELFSETTEEEQEPEAKVRAEMPARKVRKRKLSPEGRERIRKALLERWSRIKEEMKKEEEEKAAEGEQ